MSSESAQQWRRLCPERSRDIDRRSVVMKQSLLATIKMIAGCADCGYNKDPVALDFDHILGEKAFNIGQSVGAHGLLALLEEVDKCEVVCANCHRIRTVDRGRCGAV